MDSKKLYRVFESTDGLNFTQVLRYDLQSRPRLLYDYHDSLLNVYESDFIYDPDIYDENKMSIYIKIFDVNIIGVLFDSNEQIEKYITVEDLTYYVDEMVTYGHYIQLSAQPNKTYWNTKRKVFYFDDEKPFVGAMDIRVMKKGEKFVALVKVCDC